MRPEVEEGEMRMQGREMQGDAGHVLLASNTQNCAVRSPIQNSTQQATIIIEKQTYRRTIGYLTASQESVNTSLSKLVSEMLWHPSREAVQQPLSSGLVDIMCGEKQTLEFKV